MLGANCRNWGVLWNKMGGDSFYDIATSDSDFASVFAHEFLRASKVCIRLCTRVVGDFKCTKLCCTALLEWMVCLKG